MRSRQTIRNPDVAAAAEALEAGLLVAFPTETVYGLGGDAASDRAVAEIFAAKERPRINPLIVHVESLEKARTHGHFGERAEKLAKRFWPGPLTLVVPKQPESAVSPLATAGLDSIALRVPAHPAAQTLLSEFGGPVAAPSANPSGCLSPTRADHVRDHLADKVAVIVDEGATGVGLESTIVSCLTDPARLLRSGGVARRDIEQTLGHALGGDDAPPDAPIAPGQLQHHYSPRASLRLHVERAEEGEALLAFGPQTHGHAGPVRNLSPSGNVVEAAANLFAFLHELDAESDRIAVAPIPEVGLGEAINDRLRRAAAPRTLDVPDNPA